MRSSTATSLVFFFLSTLVSFADATRYINITTQQTTYTPTITSSSTTYDTQTRYITQTSTSTKTKTKTKTKTLSSTVDTQYTTSTSTIIDSITTTSSPTSTRTKLQTSTHTEFYTPTTSTFVTSMNVSISSTTQLTLTSTTTVTNTHTQTDKVTNYFTHTANSTVTLPVSTLSFTDTSTFSTVTTVTSASPVAAELSATINSLGTTISKVQSEMKRMSETNANKVKEDIPKFWQDRMSAAFRAAALHSQGYLALGNGMTLLANGTMVNGTIVGGKNVLLSNGTVQAGVIEGLPETGANGTPNALDVMGVMLESILKALRPDVHILSGQDISMLAAKNSHGKIHLNGNGTLATTTIPAGQPGPLGEGGKADVFGVLPFNTLPCVNGTTHANSTCHGISVFSVAPPPPSASKK